jgi:hypothetical protein
VKAGVDADFFSYSQIDFNDWKDDFGSIPEVASSTGLEFNLDE